MHGGETGLEEDLHVGHPCPGPLGWAIDPASVGAGGAVRLVPGVWGSQQTPSAQHGNAVMLLLPPGLEADRSHSKML